MRILIAIEDAPFANLGLEMGKSLGGLMQAELSLVTVVASEKKREQGLALLSRSVALLETAVSPVNTFVRVGNPAVEIQKAAVSGGFDLVILGASTDHLTLKNWRGSTCTRLMQSLESPLLVAKGSIHPLEKLLICESGGPQRPLLQRLFIQLPRLLQPQMQINVLHVMSQISAGPQAPGWELQAPVEELISAHTLEGQLLTQDLELLQQHQINTVPIVRHGLVVDEVVAEAEEGEYGLVVIGAYAAKGLEKLLLADQAQQIIHRSPCPVLVIR